MPQEIKSYVEEKMERSDFIKHLSLLTAGGTLLPEILFANKNDTVTMRTLSNIGIQLFSLPTALEKDFEGTIALIADMGFKEIELFGPYPYSTQTAKDHWAAVTPMLGFSGSGYFGQKEEAIKAIFDEHDLSIPAIHTDLDTLEKEMVSLGKAGESLGFEYVILPAIPDERRKHLDDYKLMADTFNAIGKKAKQVGLKFA